MEREGRVDLYEDVGKDVLRHVAWWDLGVGPK